MRSIVIAHAALLVASVLGSLAQAAPVSVEQAELAATGAAAPISRSTFHVFENLAAAPQPPLRWSSADTGHDEVAPNLEATLWALVRKVEAQRSGSRFALLDDALDVVQLQAEAVSQVPLPAAGWLLLVGVLGMLGMKGTGRQRA